MPGLLGNIRNFINAMPKGKLYTYLFICVALIGGAIISLSFLNKETYQPLFSGLSTEDASMIVAKLKEQKIPYKLTAGGTSIHVPKERLHDVRLALAGQNSLPGGGGTGFELFDKTNYGMTEFMQNVNYKRAIQGELSRTINQLPGVKSSRVHIAIPDKSLYGDREKDVTASVFLKLGSSRTLSKEEVSGIVHLVSGSVEGLRSENVTVIDSNGKVLFKSDRSDGPLALSGQQYEIQKGVERKIEESIQSMLDRFLPASRSIVRVTAELNLRKVEKVQEEYQPDKKVPTAEKKSAERSVNTTAKPGGVPGVAAAVAKNGSPPPQEDTTRRSSETQREESQITYEVGKTVSKIVEPYGDIKRLSVAVLVDGKYDKAGSGGKKEEIKYIPRTQKDLDNIKALVASAVGFNEARGDKLEVANIPFETDPLADEQSMVDAQGWKDMAFQGAKYLLIAIIAFALIFFVLKPAVSIAKLGKGSGGNTEAVKLAGIQDTLAVSEGLRQQILTTRPDAKALAPFADMMQNKALVTSILKSWVKEPA
jgi:flagellar M-ring protein FliF